MEVSAVAKYHTNPMGGYRKNLARKRKKNSVFGSSKKRRKKNGCYIATSVYGSYDCPEVWTLRRFRDYELEGTWYGRLFISIYYALSPIAVRLFGETKWFKNLWIQILNKKVADLNKKGYEDTPYNDLY